MRDAVAFYRDILGLSPALEAPRLSMFPIGTTSLILFQLGLTETDSRETSDVTGEQLTVPGHGPDKKIVDILMDAPSNASGSNKAETGDDGRLGVLSTSLRTHFCLAVPSRDEVREWESYLAAKNVKIRGVMEWKRGGRSVYFEDVDGHVGEIGSKGIWEHY